MGRGLGFVEINFPLAVKTRGLLKAGGRGRWDVDGGDDGNKKGQKFVR